MISKRPSYQRFSSKTSTLGGDFLGQGPLWAKNPILIFLRFFKVRVKNSSPIPAKSAEIIVLSFILWPHGTLNRIHYFPLLSITFPRKRNTRCGTDPGYPAPGSRITVVYTNSLKLGNRVCILRERSKTVNLQKSLKTI